MRKEDRYDSLFIYYAKQYGLDWRLLKAQAIVESALNKKAVSRVGAKGLAQFMPNTWDEIAGKEKNIYDPEDSIEAQAKYMSYLLKMLNDNIEMALAAYNWGIGNVSKLIAKRKTSDFKSLKAFMPFETQNYVERIINIYKKLCDEESNGNTN